MSSSRLGAGKPSLEEYKSILTGQSLSDKEAWVDSLKNYLTIMEESPRYWPPLHGMDCSSILNDCIEPELAGRYVSFSWRVCHCQGCGD